MKRLTAKIHERREKSRKKKLKRQQILKARAASEDKPEENKPGLPRYLKRKHELLGSTYWRGDRFVLQSYK